MTSPSRGSRRKQPLRMWWALPGAAVAGTAVGMAVVVGPTLGEHVSIPRQIVLPATAATAAPTPVATHAVKPRRHPSPKPTVPAAAATQPPRTHVVTPRRPVVTVSSDDGQEHESSADQPGAESQGAD